jgi:CO dehydrogenase/acetyl-CoA synthase delta subunit
MTGPRRLSVPREVPVRADGDGRPLSVGRLEVDAVRESWLIEDRWWTDEPLRRRYWEVVTTCGRDVIVFDDLERGGWYVQR